MNSHIDFRTLPSNIPSLCIPRVFPNIDERRIYRIFDDLRLGDIDHIDIVPTLNNTKGEKCNRVFIHFTRWYNNRNADSARERLINGNDIKVIYDGPWFWKVSAYREAPPPSSRRVISRRVVEDTSNRNSRPKTQRAKPQTREELDKEMEMLNPSIKNAPEEEQKALPVTDGIKYDINAIMKTKKREIIIRKPDEGISSAQAIMAEELNNV